MADPGSKVCRQLENITVYNKRIFFSYLCESRIQTGVRVCRFVKPQFRDKLLIVDRIGEVFLLDENEDDNMAHQ